MASNPSPSSSSDVEEEEVDNQLPESQPVTKKIKYQIENPSKYQVDEVSAHTAHASHGKTNSVRGGRGEVRGTVCVRGGMQQMHQGGMYHRERNMGRTEEPSSSQVIKGEVEPAELARVQAKLRETELEMQSQKQENEKFIKDLQKSVECPVCLSIPRAPPVPCCQNGHVICSKCREKVDVCGICRITMTNCVSQVATTIIQKIQHPCDFKISGCTTLCSINSITAHEERCGFRPVRCPHWACDENVPLTNLTSHVINMEFSDSCADNYMAKPLPYQEEIEYTRQLDDQDGNSFWRPSLLQLNNITFYLQVEKNGKNKQWYFYVQMEGAASECDHYEALVSVSKYPNSDRHSISYHGKVCPIDIKGAEELDADGYGLNVRDAVMEKIFIVDTSPDVEGLHA